MIKGLHHLISTHHFFKFQNFQKSIQNQNLFKNLNHQEVNKEEVDIFHYINDFFYQQKKMDRNRFF